MGSSHIACIFTFSLAIPHFLFVLRYCPTPNRPNHEIVGAKLRGEDGEHAEIVPTGHWGGGDVDHGVVWFVRQRENSSDKFPNHDTTISTILGYILFVDDNGGPERFLTEGGWRAPRYTR